MVDFILGVAAILIGLLLLLAGWFLRGFWEEGKLWRGPRPDEARIQEQQEQWKANDQKSEEWGQ